ncbi:hypothetical protein RND81_14G151700 [Saponaria officinalis]|uniref:Uncharacterized protein n=1 Tax=Saponaria officinalis TaxID=3572 RepID=A0AAW1GND7_SAPOF
MIPTELNNFDRFCNIFPDSISLKQTVELALIGKVISSYKIDLLSSFHDLLMQGLWKKSSNGFLYPLDNRLEELLYMEINEHFRADPEKSLEKLRGLSVAQKVFDKLSEPVLTPDQESLVSCDISMSENEGDGKRHEKGEVRAIEPSTSVLCEVVISTTHNPSRETRESESFSLEEEAFNSVAHQVFDGISVPNPFPNVVQLVETSLDDIKTPLDAVSFCLSSHEDVEIKSTEAVVIPTVFQLVLSVNEDLQRYETNVLHADYKNLNQNYLFEEMNGIVGGQFNCDLVEETLDMSKQFHDIFDDMVASKFNIKFCGEGEMSPTIICIFIYNPGAMFFLTNKAQLCTWTKFWS